MNHTIKQLNRAIEDSQRGMQTGSMTVKRQYVVEIVHIASHLEKENENLRNALRHLYHNAKKSGADMGLALEIAEEALSGK